MSSFSWRTWARAQYTPLPPVQHVDLRGRTVVITGANVGLGFEAAKHFARMRPARLVLACRSRDTGETALAGASTLEFELRAECSFS
jgi:retinol dehydrogenase-12